MHDLTLLALCAETDAAIMALDGWSAIAEPTRDVLPAEPASGPRWQWATPAPAPRARPSRRGDDPRTPLAARLTRRPELVYEQPGMAVVA
jgi:hypothetical protein